MNSPGFAELVKDLLANPKQFYDQGRGYALLQAFFAGAPHEILRTLLRSENFFVRRVAMFVTSELGIDARDLMDDVIPLLSSTDVYLQYYAMEVIAVCAHREQAPKFVLVVRMLEHSDERLRALAMYLMSRVDASLIVAAREVLMKDTSDSEVHLRGLGVLTAGQTVDPTVVSAMIGSTDPLARRYGAIGAKRVDHEYPALMKEVEASDDAELRVFRESIMFPRKSSSPTA
jgi:hypothetical protein